MKLSSSKLLQDTRYISAYIIICVVGREPDMQRLKAFESVSGNEPVVGKFSGKGKGYVFEIPFAGLVVNYPFTGPD